ncbi:hypothetical protein CPB83DRAFT_814130 [Crepidotus variabilis]|uniref:Centrosomin N-terminal motif 1 domain-containing protein n=1 Tax=Crepidotus variabilis TaxID=179855 RepID=A0A9P6JPI5_9AGAR|nr:hypothetical protein CPB83DRAFT_814130 [Crepidotus variabilis]
MSVDLSNGTHPEMSLGSLPSFLTTPGRPGFRAASASSRTTAQSSAPVATPSPPSMSASAFSRRKPDDAATSLSSRLNLLTHNDDDDDGGVDGDVLDTPAVDKKKWTDGPETPGGAAVRSKRTKGGASNGKGVTLTLRDQEKHIDNLKKENFNIKLRVHFLEDRLAQLAPDEVDAALKQNINLKIEVQQRGMEIKKLKKLVLSLEHELERLQRAGGGTSGNRSRERELEEKLEEREMEIRELRRRKSGYEDDALLRETEARNEELEDELANTKELLQDNMDEIERLREIAERPGHDSANDSMNGESGSRRELRRKIEELHAINEELEIELEERLRLVAQREDEKEDLMDQVDHLRLQLEEAERRNEAENIERSESRAMIMEEREEREAVVDNLNSMRDKYAALVIELQQREDELELKAKEIEELISEHQRIVEVVEDEWKGEVEEARTQVEELRDVLSERETECKDLRMTISELEANTNDLHSKFEVALAHLEEEADQKDAELENLQETIDKLGEQVYHLEDENERMKEEHQRMAEDEGAERERLEALAAAFKEKIANLKDELQQMNEMYEAVSQDIHDHRSRQEELAQHVEQLVDEVQRERNARERLESELDTSEKDHETALRREKRALEGKESALQSALNDLARTQSLLSQRETDIQAVQNALQTIEQESKRIGETHTTARFSLQLETDRLKRDLERVEDELARARKELNDKDSRNRDRDSNLDKLYGENRDLASQLAAQTQARLNISEKLDSTMSNLRGSESEANSLRSKIADLESRLSKDQRSLLNAESQYRDQLTERNTLLLTIYQYLDKILGVDKTPKKAGQAETKPFTNFSVFHDNLITRLKALSQIQMDFEKRCKDTESRFTEKINDMRKQLESRWRQIDKFEGSLKTYAETKAGWKRKFAQKEGELDALKTTNAELSAQVLSVKRPGGSESMEIRSLATRAANAERRLNNAQNQLLSTEERIAQLNQKNATADQKWEARVKEYEARLKAAEERVKRERQGSKERVLELENNLKSLQRQFELAQKRNSQLNDIVDTNKPNGPGGTPTR